MWALLKLSGVPRGRRKGRPARSPPALAPMLDLYHHLEGEDEAEPLASADKYASPFLDLVK